MPEVRADLFISQSKATAGDRRDYAAPFLRRLDVSETEAGKTNVPIETGLGQGPS